MESSSRAPFSSFKDELTPAIRWYGLSITVLVVGLALLYVFTVEDFNRILNALQQCKSSSTCEFYLPSKGQHGIYLETATVYDDTSYSATLEESEGLTLTVVNKETGLEVPQQSFRGKAPYTLWVREGVALGAFDVEEPGAYLVTVGPSPAGESKPLIVAVSSLNPSYEVMMMFSSRGLWLLMIGVGAVGLWAAVFIMRKRDKESKHWSKRGGKMGNPRPSVEPAATATATTVTSDGEPDYDLRPNGKRKKRKK